LSAKTKFDVHSPFVFNLLTKAILPKTFIKEQEQIEKLRRKLISNYSEINFIDYGAGSLHGQTNKRKISEIVSSSAKSKKYAALLYRLTNYLEAKTVVEFGTSLGISTAYFAAAKPSKVYTMEGCMDVSEQAVRNMEELGFKNIQFLTGNFNHLLPELLNQIKTFDIAFIDGNHCYQPTISYFNLLLEKRNENSCLIFDDINWSGEMKQAWYEISNDARVTISIDLFFIGVVFVNKKFTKQHFVLRY
jgi:predicted O-methyltransferase YrrM